MYAAARWLSPSLKASTALTGQERAHTPQPVHRSRSMYLGCCSTCTVKSPTWPDTPATWAQVMISILRCRPHSTSLGDRMHIEQSLVGKVLSSWDITPPMVGDDSTR